MDKLSGKHNYLKISDICLCFPKWSQLLMNGKRLINLLRQFSINTSTNDISKYSLIALALLWCKGSFHDKAQYVSELVAPVN